MSNSPLAVVQEAYAAFGRGDIPALLALLAGNVSWEVAGQPGAYPTFGRRHGLDGALAFFQAVDATESFEAFTPKRFHAADDVVTVEGDCAIVLRTNGKRLAYDWVHIWTVADGRITGFREFYDTALVVEAYAA